MLDGNLPYNIWLQLPNEVRHKLVTLFDIPRSGRTEVEYRATGPVVTSDGYTPTDLLVITKRRMQELLGSKSENFFGLFEELVEHLDAILAGTYTVLIASSSEGEERIVMDTAPSIASINKDMDEFVRSPAFKELKRKPGRPKKNG